MKTCPKCSIAQPLDEFGKCRNYKDGLSSWCRGCKKIAGSAYYAANTERLKAENSDRHWANRDRNLANMRKYAAEHPTTWTPEGAAARKKYRSTRVEEIKLSARAYRSANREAITHAEAQRRAAYRGAVGSHTVQEWRDKCALLGNVCIYCGEDKPLTRDHKIPLSRGGSHNIENIVPACLSCNSSKRDKTAPEFIAWRLAVAA